MQPNENTYFVEDNRSAGLMALAIVGFIALVAAGMYLAVYSARYVPTTISKIGSAAVALSSVFTHGPSGLAVVPGSTSTTTIPFGDSTTTTSTTTTTPPASTGTGATTAGPETTTSTQIGGTTAPAAYFGLPDLAVNITSVGYLTTNSPDSFVAAAVVPNGYRPAVKFTVKNIGTNVAGAWRFSAVIPTTIGFQYQSVAQQPLNPGDSIDYTLGFDQATTGTGETISITANFDNAIAESNSGNDTATALVTVQ